jgi:hypothetical protein
VSTRGDVGDLGLNGRYHWQWSFLSSPRATQKACEVTPSIDHYWPLLFSPKWEHLAWLWARDPHFVNKRFSPAVTTVIVSAWLFYELVH